MRKQLKNQDHRYVNRLSDVADKSFFFLFVLLGSVSIIALKLYEFEIYYIYPIPIVLMFVYALWCYHSPYFKLRLDKAGDNIYYMGFLFTLISLGVSLYQTAELGASQEAIISNFGIALITTICGIAGRVVFTQFRDTPYEVEQETVSSLAVAAGRLQGELDATLADFSTFRTALRQSINEWNVEWRSERESQLKTTTAFIDENISLIIQKNQKAATAIQQLTQDLGQVSNKLVNMNFSKDLLKEQLEGPVNELQDFMEKFALSFSHRLKEIDDTSNSLVEFIEKQQSFADAVALLEEHTIQQTTLSKNMIVDLINHLESFGVFVDNEGERLEVQTNAMVEQIKRLTKTYENLSSQAEEKQGRFQVAFGELGNKLTDSHDALAGAVVQQTHLLKKMLIEDLGEFAKLLPQRLQEISDSGTALNELTEKENFLAKTVVNFAEHNQQLISISKDNMSALTNDIDSFGKMVHLQNERLDQQVNRSEDHFNKIAALYEKMATNAEASHQRLNGDVNELSYKLKESYALLLKLVESQNKLIQQVVRKSQQPQEVPVPAKKREVPTLIEEKEKPKKSIFGNFFGK